MEQVKALEILKSGKNVFLTGEPGAGKSYTINQFTDWLDEQGTSYAVTASTGIAASHINGATIHSWSGIGIMENLDESDINGIRFAHYHYNRIVSAEVLILDEVSMLKASFIDDLSNVLKAVHKSDKPFGGIQVVMVGDFFQLPPVSRGGIAKFAFEAEAWKEADFQVCYLTEQHRQADPVFTEILRAMRFGTMTEQHKEILRAQQQKPESTTKLFTHNADVDAINTQKLNELPGNAHNFKMESTGHPKAVEILKKNCLSPELLSLKEGAVVMFTANRPDKGHVNGTIGVIDRFAQDGSPIVRLKDGGTIYVERSAWKAYDSHRSIIATITQYPLRLAWAITVHKSQGMSLDAASIDLTKAFEFGQGYVAISRVRSLEGLHLVGLGESAFMVNPKVLEQDQEFRKMGV